MVLISFIFYLWFRRSGYWISIKTGSLPVICRISRLRMARQIRPAFWAILPPSSPSFAIFRHRFVGGQLDKQAARLVADEDAYCCHRLIFPFDFKYFQTGSFINVNQCVLPWRPVGCPNRGWCGVSAKICGTLIWSSFHLKISTPPGLSTRKHSAKPWLMSSRQSWVSCPYFLANHDFFPARTRCGIDCIAQAVIFV